MIMMMMMLIIIIIIINTEARDLMDISALQSKQLFIVRIT